MKAYKYIFAAICAGAIMASCTPKEQAEIIITPEEDQVLPAQMCVISIDAAKGISSKALALDAENNKLNATWEEGETVSVFKKGSNKKLGTLAPVTTGVASTKLEGEIDIAGLTVDDELYLVYPDVGFYTSGNCTWSYDFQDGTLETISKDYDYATATVKVKDVADDHLSAEAAAFKNQQAIVNFNLKNSANGEALAVEPFVIVSGTRNFVGGYDSSWEPKHDDLIYVSGKTLSEYTVAVPVIDDTRNDDYYFLGAVGSGTSAKYYELMKYGARFEKGKYYTGSLGLSEVSYTVAGSSGAGPGEADDVFGLGWTPSLADNDMEFRGFEFAKVYGNVKAGTIMELKVVKNHDWNVESYPAKNIIVTAWADGDLYVIYSPFGNVPGAYMVYPVEPEIPAVYTIAFQEYGDFYLNTPANDLTDNKDGTYSYTTVLEAGEYRFKIFKDRAYDVAEWPAPDQDPYYINVEKRSTVTITFTPDENKIDPPVIVPFEEPDAYRVAGIPALVFGTEWDPVNDANLMTLQSDGKTYSKTYAAVPACTVFEFKITVNGAVWIPDGPNQTYVNPAAGDVTISYNTETGAITVDGPAGDFYRVAGDSEGDNSGSDIVFGTAWAPANNANLMIPEGEDLYSITYPSVPAGTTLTFKITKNGGEWWSPDPNQTFTTASDSDVAITYHPSDGVIEVFAYNDNAGMFNYHGTVYPVVGLKDGKWWMAKNLAYLPEGFSVSTSLSEVTAGVFAPLVANSEQKTAEFSTDADVIAAKGYLYQAEVALGLHVGDLTSVEAAQALEGAQGICPSGWHVPTGSDIIRLVGKSVGLTTNSSAPYYDGSNGLISRLNADGFNMDAYGAITIQDNTKTEGTFMGWNTNYPNKISSGMFCGSTYAGVTYNTANDQSSGVKNLQFYGFMPMTNKATEADYTCNGSKVSYRIAGPVRCVRN